MMYEDAGRVILQSAGPSAEALAMLQRVGFEDSTVARQRLVEICPDDGCRDMLACCLPMLLAALSEAATPDGSLVNFERYLQSVPNQRKSLSFLADNPRAVEILVKLFVGSQFLTEILLRNPVFLEELTNHKRLAEFKSRPQFVAEAATAAVTPGGSLSEKLDALRRRHHWELLRIGACDTFGLFDLKSVTVQLSLLADSVVQLCLNLLAEEQGISADGFAVIAFGKLGGEELNYSSDIDLVFIADRDASRFWRLGQNLIKALMESTGEGFFYRVDMRLRPWGRSGALVNTLDAHVDYLKKHGMDWEKQALLKARAIAGNRNLGRQFLDRVEPMIFSTPANAVRKNIREMKAKIESRLHRQGRKWGDVKAGYGSIRDIEFVTQGLQLIHGNKHPDVRSINTMDGLIRLADFGFLHADEFRHLTSGYLFLRTIEHALQLMHHKQTHSLPESPRELAYLARRLDFADADHFIQYYEQHCTAIRAVYAKYIEKSGSAESLSERGSEQNPDHRQWMAPSYAEKFCEEEIANHARLLKKLSADNLLEIEAVPTSNGRWRLTVVGFNHTGELSLMCGLLFVYGYNIFDGNAFTTEQVSVDSADVADAATGAAARTGGKGRLSRKFVNVFTLRPPLTVVPDDVWLRYRCDFLELVQIVRDGRPHEASGQLAKRVAGALHDNPHDLSALFPVEIEIDNETSPTATILQIRSEDTIGFLYELSNALAMTGIEIERVVVSSVGNQVCDTLFVTDTDGRKLDSERRQRELRAAVVLIKHFTHLLPRSPNPETALLQFRDLLTHLFEQPNWPEELSSLQSPVVLQGLAKLLGVSEFLWEDFLRLQHSNLFPVITDVEALAVNKSKKLMRDELRSELISAADFDAQRERLNAFKDREMFRIDMRHILGHIHEFGRFAEELSDLAAIVVSAAVDLCLQKLTDRYGTPRIGQTRQCPFSVCALGKCGGKEMGFASDVELMFVYEDGGSTSGPETVTTAESITTTEFFLKLVELFNQTIKTRQKGIFQIDLRLRPYGKAGALAVSLDAFRTYFSPQGAAWPYERQALVKLRPIAGDKKFGQRVAALRDELVYTGEPFDVTAMRAMREKQIRQLVQAGSFNAKLSPGGLVDCEYLVQGLQITHGKKNTALKTRSTRKAIRALHRAGVISAEIHDQLQEAYMFLRRLIDALRMVRGNARDLTVPHEDEEEFQFLARRLDYGHNTKLLKENIELQTQRILDLSKTLL